MDLIVQARCYFCDKIFCCPEHRRSHELLAHQKKNRKFLQQITEKKKSQSYALEMRKYLYSDLGRSNLHNSRKRKFLAISKVVHEQKVIEFKLSNRKILVPRKKYIENPYLSNVKKTDKIGDEEANGNSDSEKSIDGDGFISPIDEKKGKNVNPIFTTSTPLSKRVHLMSSFSPQLSDRLITAPLESIIEDIPGVMSIQKDCVRISKSYRRRKVTFSEEIESVYRKATGIVPTESKSGIFATVTNAFQAVFTRIPGFGEVKEETFSIPCSPGGSKRKRASRDLLREHLAITGRRPLRQQYKLLAPEN